MGEFVGEKAVVLGCGMAGLLTARVLADRYRHVLLVDRDEVVGVSGSRRGVPQAHHAHALLAKGQQILEELFPGLQDELVAGGALIGDLAGDLLWYFNDKPLKQQDCGLLSVSATRPQLEEIVRARVLALSNVDVRERTVIRGLETVSDGGEVVGARVVGVDASAPAEVVRADLVVDATGRGSRAPTWLAELGYQRPDEERIKIDLAYTSRFFRLDSDPFGPHLAINPVASPGNPRGAFFGKLPEQTALVSLTGMLGDHPPADHRGFLEFTRSLPAPEIYPALRGAEPLGEPATFKVPASVRRRFDKLSRFPAGFVVVGDGVCAFNPVYGQGMTVAAMEAVALADHLEAGAVRPLEFFREIAPVIDVPWEISAGGDLAFPGVEGARTLKVKFGNAYMGRLHTAAQRDGRFAAEFFRVAGLVDPPQALMRPRMVLDVLRTSRGPDPMPQPTSDGGPGGSATPPARDLAA